MDVAIEFNSLSKTYNMAGWRVGMAVGNAVAVEALARTKTNIDSGIFRPIQDAAIVALTGDQSWLVERNEIYRERRDMILAHCTRWASRRRPQASLYIWAETPQGFTSSSSRRGCWRRRALASPRVLSLASMARAICASRWEWTPSASARPWPA